MEQEKWYNYKFAKQAEDEEEEEHSPSYIVVAR